MSALNGELADLGRWPAIELQLVERTEKLLLGIVPGDEDREERRARPLTQAALFAAYEALVHELGLPSEWVEPPEFAIRSYVYFKDPNPPEPLLLNSFFLTDLALAHKLFAEGKAPQRLRDGVIWPCISDMQDAGRCRATAMIACPSGRRDADCSHIQGRPT